ncbi:MAG: putative glycosyl hydrolase [Candidatus Acidoferrum typicum]|nr:putative glycosyl hydrolase [Candidatus Acidoferrum typicum]
MNLKQKVSRRKFVSSAVSASAISVLPGSQQFLREFSGAIRTRALEQNPVPLTTTPAWRDQGILNLAKSPYAKLHSVPVHAVTIEAGFWSLRRETNVNASIPSMGKLLEVNGRMDNFRRLKGKSSAAQRGPVYSDSDIYKWIEAAGFALQSGELPELRTTVDKDIHEIVAAQQADGYLNTYYVQEHAAQRMEPKTQQHGHELYCIGHLLQGGIAYYRATGDRTLLDAGTRFVNEFLVPNFGPGSDKKPLFSGHPEMELALIELYRLTGDKRQLELSGYLLAGDSRIHFKPEDYVYHFCGVPFTSRTHLEGHAVRAMYACCGATDYYLETGDQTYWKTLNVLWKDLVSAQMYVTGGVGSRSDGEAFGDPYELPNARAYGESCAAIGNMMWNWRMLAATGEAKYADVIERALYNGINSGMSLNGALYCYRNPLAFDPSRGDKIRNEWYDTTCCPPNLERTLASLPGYFYSTSDEGVYVHLYDNSQLNWHLENGTGLTIQQKTNYPWEGSVELTVATAEPVEFTLFVRIPGWTDTARVAVNGKAISDAIAGQYLPIRRRWSGDDTVRLQFNMAPQILEANAQVTENNGRAAVQRGPLVYCMEQIDQGEGVALKDVALSADKASSGRFEEKFDNDLLGGVLVLRHAGTVHEESADRSGLYFSHDAAPPKSRPVQLTFIPYYAWANRVQTPMQVWTPVARA